MEEKQKYEILWGEFPEYRKVAPGTKYVKEFLEWSRPESVYDIGCGTGRAGEMMLAHGVPTVGIDFADNCLDDDVYVGLLAADITKPLPKLQKKEYFYCTDLLEHIPEEDIHAALSNIKSLITRGGFFSISLTEDSLGKLIGETLHVCVKPKEWWIELLKQYFKIVHYECVGNDLIVFVDGGCYTEMNPKQYRWSKC